MITLRIFAALAAAFLVAAIALGSMLPIGEPLGQVIANLDGTLLPHMQSSLGPTLWRFLTLPLLVRPPWLAPLAAGIICLGAVTTLTWRQTPPRRRRS